MAETSPNTTSRQEPPAFGTPISIVIGGLLLFVISTILAGLANVAVQNNAQQLDGPPDAWSTYTFFMPAVLVGLVSGCMLIIGSIRWALYGRTSVGVSSQSSFGDEGLATLRSINERQLLSETAKRIAYRHEDIEALRATIRADISKHNFDAALVLVAELAQTYGYLEEAEVYRDQITAARMADQEQKITTAIAHLEEIITRKDFERAGREVSKMQRLYPDSERVKNLSRRVVEAREQYKLELEREFLAASERDDVDKAMQLLKELDKYLNPSEAAPFTEIARGVIGKKRDNLGVQFKIAVNDKEWLRAVRIGEQIIAEFPKSRMSVEIRGTLDMLRQNAAAQQATSAAY